MNVYIYSVEIVMVKITTTEMNPPTGGWLLASLIYDSIWQLKNK